MKTSELTGAALNWAVCVGMYGYGADYKTNRYSTDWTQGGPIIEREEISMQKVGVTQWKASTGYADSLAVGYGPTPLIAAMRCFVASKLGDDIEIPKELA